MHVTVYLICALVTALMAAYGIWRTIRIAHLGTTSKLAVTAFFALAGASHFAFLDMTDLFERAFIVDTLPVTGLFVSFAYWFFLLALARDVIGGVRGLVRRKMGLPVEKRDLFTIVSTCFVAVFGIFFGITSTWNALSEPTVEPMTRGRQEPSARARGLQGRPDHGPARLEPLSRRPHRSRGEGRQ